MRAILNNDIIVRLTNSDDGIEIGDLPKDIGLERLRFNGSQIIDLADLSAFWIELNFILHSIEVPNSQYVVMSYSDRRYLTIDNGIIRLKTQQEIDADIYANGLENIKNKLRNRLKNSIGDIQDQHMQTLAFVCALIIYVRQQPQQLSDFFDSIIPDIIECFPLGRWESILKQGGKDLKTALIEYYTNLDALNSD